jgi:F-type H+-transporting ATPase subunit epsilon
MAKSDTFHCSVVTPEGPVLEASASFVALPLFDGELGVLAHRAPLLAQLGAGKLRVEGPEGKKEFFVAGGFVQVVGAKLTVLTPECRPVGEIRRGAAERDLQAALALPGRSAATRAVRERSITRARAQLRASS